MAISVNDLITSVGLNPKHLKTVKWGQSVDSSSIGIYIVSTSKLPNENSNLYAQAPIDENVLKFWLNKVPAFQLDGKQNPPLAELKQRLSNFWLPDENIIYIGQTQSGEGLKSRIRQYYNTEIGERKPHAGGHWIKTLKILNELYVHYIPDNNPKETEDKIQKIFVEQVSTETKNKLYDSSLSIPFANLELEQGNRKKHGISKSKLSD